MNDFLDRLYRLTQATRRVPREDFLSLCLGRQLERDRPLTGFLVERVLQQGDRLGGWVPPPDWKRRVEARAQVTGWVHDERRPVRADLVLSLLGHPAVQLVIEAKVGDSVPSPNQLEDYRRAFPGALVVSLVEERRRGQCPPTAPVLSWNDVLAGLGAGGRADRNSRHELRDLLLHARTGDARLAIPPAAWAKAVHLRNQFPKLVDRLEQCIVALGPNEEVRRALSGALASEDQRCEASEGFGAGVWLNKSLPGSAIQGLCLSLDAGELPREVVWKLEIYATKALTTSLRVADDTPWRVAPNETRWFVTDLVTSDGDRTLRKRDFELAVAYGRAALRALHHQHTNRSWHARGDGTAPFAPRVRIPAIRQGIRAWNPVFRALLQALHEVLLQLVGRSEAGRRRYQWRDGGYLTSPGALRARVRLRARVAPDLSALEFDVEGGDQDLDSRWIDHVDDWGVPGPEPTFDGVAIRIPLSEANWNHPELVIAICALLHATLAVAP